MRRARVKSSETAFYHVLTRVAGAPRYFPLQRRQAWRKLLEMIQKCVEAYCCRLVAYQIMGNHYHLILYFDSYRRLSSAELRRRARCLYGENAASKTQNWSPHDWEQFNRRLFDLSSLMQRLNGPYAQWFNRRFSRRGHFWADRYKNPQLLDLKALQECLFYVELNALRAGLVRRPEQWKAGSARLRRRGRDQQLMPLQEIFPDLHPTQLPSFYRSQLYQRAALGPRPLPSQKPTPTYLRRQRFFTDGLAIGQQESVRLRLNQWRLHGAYQRRKNPVPQLSGFLFTLREQRSHALS